MKKVKVETTGLENLKRALSQNKISVKVGILEDKASRGDGPNNATIGLVHEFGSKSKGINENSFLRMPLNEVLPKRIDQERLKEKRDIEDEIARLGSMKKLATKIGAMAVSVIREAFMSKGFGTWSNNKPIDNKTGMPLMDTQQLVRSITYKVE